MMVDEILDAMLTTVTTLVDMKMCRCRYQKPSSPPFCSAVAVGARLQNSDAIRIANCRHCQNNSIIEATPSLQTRKFAVPSVNVEQYRRP